MDHRAVLIGCLLFSFGFSNAENSKPDLKLPENHKNTSDVVPDYSKLKMEARDTDTAINLETIDKSGSKVPAVNVVARNDPKKDPIISELGSWRTVKVTPKKDSYLEALEHSHAKKSTRPISYKSIRREYTPGPVYVPETDYGAPKDSQNPYGTVNIASKTPRVVYGEPSDSYNYQSEFNSYNQPQPQYGAPSKQYGPPSYPQSSYGPPSNSYLPSAPQQAYGPPPASTFAVPFSLPELSSAIPMIDFTWPFALKLNAFTLAKILLKLVIFKMIVKFIAVICLLLFIPKLEFKKGNKNDDEDEEERSLDKRSITWEKLNILTRTILESYEKYEAINKTDDGSSKRSADEPCDTFECSARRALGNVDTWTDYMRLFASYASEEISKQEKTKQKR